MDKENKDKPFLSFSTLLKDFGLNFFIKIPLVLLGSSIILDQYTVAKYIDEYGLKALAIILGCYVIWFIAIVIKKIRSSN